MPWGWEAQGGWRGVLMGTRVSPVLLRILPRGTATTPFGQGVPRGGGTCPGCGPGLEVTPLVPVLPGRVALAPGFGYGLAASAGSCFFCSWQG